MKTSKVCFKCNIEKPLDEFYKHSQMLDGHVNKCKSCNLNDVHEHRLKNIDKIREYDRERAKNPERAKKAAEVSERWRKADKRRTQCHNAVTRAIRKGVLTAENCCKCGAEKTYAHHESYDRPLDVQWYCQPCHKQRHKEMVLEGIEI